MAQASRDITVCSAQQHECTSLSAVSGCGPHRATGGEWERGYGGSWRPRGDVSSVGANVGIVGDLFEDVKEQARHAPVA